jgi:hypothetical protein
MLTDFVSKRLTPHHRRKLWISNDLQNSFLGGGQYKDHYPESVYGDLPVFNEPIPETEDDHPVSGVDTFINRFSTKR